jgi:hypothetical protein
MCCQQLVVIQVPEHRMNASMFQQLGLLVVPNQGAKLAPCSQEPAGNASSNIAACSRDK